PVTQSPLVNPNAFRSTFSHANEDALPGYYGVALHSGGTVELTTTTRTRSGRFTFDTGRGTDSVIVNVGGSVDGVLDGAASLDRAGRKITGWPRNRIGGGSAAPSNVYFTAAFDHPFAAWGTWTGVTLSPGSPFAGGGQSGAYLTFDTGASPVVHAK